MYSLLNFLLVCRKTKNHFHSTLTKLNFNNAFRMLHQSQSRLSFT